MWTVHRVETARGERLLERAARQHRRPAGAGRPPTRECRSADRCPCCRRASAAARDRLRGSAPGPSSASAGLCGEHRPVADAEQRDPRVGAARRRSSSVTATATPASAKSPCRREISWKAQPRASGVGAGIAISVEQLAGLERRREQPGEEIRRAHRARAPALLRSVEASRSSASITAGSSAAGSACARLPPIVPRLRIAAMRDERHRLAQQRRAARR